MRSLWQYLVALAGALVPAGGGAMETPAEASCERGRARMVGEIGALARETGAETGRAALSTRVMAAMGSVPRHEFVMDGDRSHAYANRPLSIGRGQTISQPYIVALMTDLMEIKPGDRVSRSGPGRATRRRCCPGSRARSTPWRLSSRSRTRRRSGSLGSDTATWWRARATATRAARAGPVRRDHGYRCASGSPAAAHRPVEARRKAGGADRRAAGRAVAARGGEKSRRSVARRSILAVRFVPMTGASEKQQ